MRYHDPMPDESDRPRRKPTSPFGSNRRAGEQGRTGGRQTELAAQINRVARTRQHPGGYQIRYDMATNVHKDDISRVLSAIDAFAKKSENQNTAVTLHGPMTGPGRPEGSR